MTASIWFLKRSRLFQELSPEDLDYLERRAVARRFRPKDIVYFPGDSGEWVMVLTRGRVKIKDITPEGKETILAFIDEGELFGEMALVDDGGRQEYAEAMEECHVLAIPREVMLWLMHRRPEFSLSVTKLVGARWRKIQNRLRNIMFHSNRERVLLILAELLESHGRKGADGWEIGLRLSHQDLASLIGATRETVTLLLGQLQEEGIVQIRRRRIIITDPDRVIGRNSNRSPRSVHENGQPSQETVKQFTEAD